MDEEKFEEILKEKIKKILNEATRTGAVAPYHTPFAFNQSDEEGYESKEDWMKDVNKQYGYTLMNDVATPEAIQDFYAYFKDMPPGDYHRDDGYDREHELPPENDDRGENKRNVNYVGSKLPGGFGPEHDNEE